MHKHIQCALIGIVQVLQDNHQGLDGSSVGQEIGDRLHEPVALLLGVALWAKLYPQPLPYLGDDARHISGTRPQFFTQVFNFTAENIGAQCLDKGQVGQ
ncbi:hypothetical protein ES708_34590 [subsurface metagenome]